MGTVDLVITTVGALLYNPLVHSLFSVNLQHNTYTSRETREVSEQDILFIENFPENKTYETRR